MRLKIPRFIRRHSLLSRSDFPIFSSHPDLIYFDTAATAQKPACVIDRICSFYANEYATVHRSLYQIAKEAEEQYHASRVAVQRFLGAPYVEEIIFTRGATNALNLVATSFGRAFLEKGDVILLTEVEHHANLVPWQFVARERGATLKFLHVDDKGRISLEQLERVLKEGVKILSLPHISHSTGVRHPIEEIAPLAKKWGAIVCLDGAQSAAHIGVNVMELGVDFFLFSAHKAYGPSGVGVLWGKKELLEKMPPIEGGGDMIDRVTLEKTTFAKLPLKFEAGTPMIASVIGLKEALGYLERIGMEKIEAFEEGLVHYAYERLSEIPGMHILGGGAPRGALLSFTVEGIHPLDLTTLLDCKGIAIRSGHLCSQPTLHRFGLPSLCRLSFGLYNTRVEIDRFMLEMEQIVCTLR